MAAIKTKALQRAISQLRMMERALRRAFIQRARSARSTLVPLPPATEAVHRVTHWRRPQVAMGIYVLLLLVSTGVRATETDPAVPADLKTLQVSAVSGERLLISSVQLAYQELGSSNTQHPPVVLLHGSPGQGGDLTRLGEHVSEAYRLIVPDLPGFGHSTRNVPDYSIRAHARYVWQLLDRLGIERVHVVGFSMGGGVGLNLAELAPGRVTSLTMLSAIGVQEMELLGDYRINHWLHGVQLAGLWLLRNGVPYMGWLDNAMLDVSYARNFFDSDQRPLRGVLSRYEGPMLIVHGKSDTLVPVQAALEHHRLVPQSELQLLDENHFAVFTHPAALAPRLKDFFERAAKGQAAMRATATPERVTASQLPFDPVQIPAAMGVVAVVLFLFLAGSTLVSEDLTCVAAGVMVAQGRVSLLLAASGCLAGIYLGDLLLFLLGRVIGRSALKRAPLKWFLRDRDVALGSAWFSSQGFKVIVASRFLPGTRLPTYFAAGLLHTSFWKFAIYFFLAAVVWTPALVALSAWLGGGVIESSLLQGRDLGLKLSVTGVVVFLTTRLLLSIVSYKGRRLLVSSWRRVTRWEFWPPWVFYLPVLCYIILLALKHRSLTLFTAVNPAMPASGFIGESKSEILWGLAGAGDCIARFSVIEASGELSGRLSQAKAFMAENGLNYPVVLKPDAGQRGSGVAVVRSDVELEDYLRNSHAGFSCRKGSSPTHQERNALSRLWGGRRPGERSVANEIAFSGGKAPAATIIQEYVPGAEFGVFYYRFPNASHGRIFSITEKKFPRVTGNGKSSVERLILDDARAVCMAKFYLNQLMPRLRDVPETGEAVQLVELGTHCRGAVFLNGGWLKTEALEAAIDGISKTYDGFYFGRYDIRTPCVEDFKQGRNFKVVELNGVTSEATHIYDPKNSLLEAYQVLFTQWRIAFEIGAQNRQRSARPTPLRTLASLIFEFNRRPRFT
jgi:pimeloyl-ACP methyl ester carboxylesterase/membrane protein DedA with SNARE-associated domain